MRVGTRGWGRDGGAPNRLIIVVLGALASQIVLELRCTRGGGGVGPGWASGGGAAGRRERASDGASGDRRRVPAAGEPGGPGGGWGGGRRGEVFSRRRTTVEPENLSAAKEMPPWLGFEKEESVLQPLAPWPATAAACSSSSQSRIMAVGVWAATCRVPTLSGRSKPSSDTAGSAGSYAHRQVRPPDSAHGGARALARTRR